MIRWATASAPTSHLSTLSSLDAANRLLEDSNFIYTYDANGNLTAKTTKATGDQTVYTYDPENQLIRVERFTLAGGATPVLVAEYRYDPLGRRIEKDVNGVITRFVYDNEDIILEVDGTGRSQAITLHGPGIDEPLAVSRRTEAGFGTFIYHADGLGSITTLTDPSGTPVRSYTYDSFGRIVDETGTVIDPYTYTGQEFDPETGLFYYRARYYNPQTGRFLQEDAFPRFGVSSYPYSRNNPIRFIDPSGLIDYARVGRGLVKVTASFGGLLILGAIETGSGGTATAVVIVGAHFAVAGLTSGFFDIAAGLTPTPRCVPTLSPTLPTVVTLAATRGNIDAARTADTLASFAVSAPSAVKTLVGRAPDLAKLQALGALGDISVNLISDPNVRDFTKGTLSTVPNVPGALVFPTP